jgi:hypothetical protein
MDRHLWVVVSDPSQDARRIALVNITTLRSRSDRTCILQCGDHTYIDHESCIEYAGYQSVTIEFLEDRESRGHIARDTRVSDTLLKRIRQGAIDSRFSPFDLQTVLIEQGLAFPF